MNTGGMKCAFIAMAMASTALSAQRAFAQDADGEIIITALKRDQAIQDVPVAVSAITGEQLQTAGFQSLQDISSRIPTLQVQDNGIVARFSMRGINLNSISDASESPIQVVFDGTPLGSSSNFAATLFDVDRIEVLRGPQGTLYGRNATGGLVSISSKRPTDDFGGYASAQYGNFDRRVFEGAVGGALTEGVRFRAALKSDTDHGIQRNIIDGSRWWKSDMFAGRLQLGVDISDDADILLRAYRTEMDGIGPGYGLFGNRVPGSLATACAKADTVAGNCVTAQGIAGTNKVTSIISGNSPMAISRSSWGTSSELNWAIGDQLKLFALTSYDELKKYRREDADASTEAGNTIGSGNDYKQFSQELRLQGMRDDLSWTAGLFYFWSKAHVTSDFGFYPAAQRDLGYSNVTTKSFAAFVDGTYALSPQINLTLGGRFTNEKKQHEGLNLAPLVMPFISPKVSVPFDFSASNDVFTWRAVLDYHASDDVMSYASVSTGFKAPGFQTQYIFSTDPFAAAASDKEEVTTYELGLKSAWLERTLTLNLAAYYSDYRGLQQVLTVPTPIGVNTPVLTNVAKAELYGIEGDLNFVPNEYFDLTAGGSYLHTEIKDPGTAFDGHVVSSAPKYNFALTGRTHLPLGNEGKATLQASYRWQSRVYFNLNQERLQSFGSYGLLDLRVIVRPPQFQSLSVEAFANNALNKKYWVHAFGSGAIGGGTVAIWGQPRMYGLKATVEF
jgi:iron complex outermembrane recepter protein